MVAEISDPSFYCAGGLTNVHDHGEYRYGNKKLKDRFFSVTFRLLSKVFFNCRNDRLSGLGDRLRYNLLWRRLLNLHGVGQSLARSGLTVRIISFHAVQRVSDLDAS